MKILFTSDLHGLLTAFERFSSLLADGDYDLGIIAGDVLDDGFKPELMEEAISSTDLEPDDYLPELAGEDEDFSRFADRQLERLYDPQGLFIRTLEFVESKAKVILESSGKPVYIIPGNHDLTTWRSEGRVINIHDERRELGGYNIVGYRWTSLDRDRGAHRRDIRKLRRFVDGRTLLVTHSPPYGVLDDVEREHSGIIHYGSRPIRRMVDARRPILHLFGHIHVRFGQAGRSVNGSFPTRRSFVEIDVQSDANHTIRYIETGITDPIGE